MYLAEDRILCWELVSKEMTIGFLNLLNWQPVKLMFLKQLQNFFRKDEDGLMVPFCCFVLCITLENMDD